jgi:transcription elongation factor GreA
MQPNEKVHLTRQGFEELNQELQQLTGTKLPAAIERVAKAREFGDLAENSEYHNAREDLAMLEGRMEELQALLKRAVIINGSRAKTKAMVDLGCQVVVVGNGQTQTFEIVGEWEADPTKKKISAQSPLGKVLMGKKVGETAELEAPAGKILYTVKKIN